MVERTISRAEARRAYDRLGSGLDRAERFEARARQLALDWLNLAPGQRVVQVGVGTGAAHAALAAAVTPTGLVVGLDLSHRMLTLTRQRAATPLVEGDAARLPFPDASFDRLLSTYLLDLLPTSELVAVLTEFGRVLRPGGRLVLASLTEGIDPASRVFVALWRLVYRLDPVRLGGCRPVHLAPLVERAGLVIAARQVIIQRGFPSEIIAAAPATQSIGGPESSGA